MEPQGKVFGIGLSAAARRARMEAYWWMRTGLEWARDRWRRAARPGAWAAGAVAAARAVARPAPPASFRCDPRAPPA